MSSSEEDSIDNKPLPLKKPFQRKLCSTAGCKNGVVQGGVCIAHGAIRRKCKFPGCDKNSKSKGLCSRHGPPRKKCEAPGCLNVSVKGGTCKAHCAYGTTECAEPDCSNLTSRGETFCKLHSTETEAAVAEEDNDEELKEDKASNKRIKLDENPAPAPSLSGVEQELQTISAEEHLAMVENKILLENALARNTLAVNNILAMGDNHSMAGGLMSSNAAYLKASMGMNPYAVNPMLSSLNPMVAASMGGLSPLRLASMGLGSSLLGAGSLGLGSLTAGSLGASSLTAGLGGLTSGSLGAGGLTAGSLGAGSLAAGSLAASSLNAARQLEINDLLLIEQIKRAKSNESNGNDGKVATLERDTNGDEADDRKESEEAN